MPTARARLRARVSEALLRALAQPESQVGSIYGLILIGSLMAAESNAQETHLDVALSAVITLLVYWLAHAYSFALARRIQSSEALSPRSLRNALVGSMSVMQGAIVPTLALLISWAAGASTQTGLDVALWSTVVTLFALELLAGVRAKAGPVELTISCVVGAGLGAAVLALKALLH